MLALIYIVDELTSNISSSIQPEVITDFFVMRQGIDFNIGIFTNLTQDHLDFHKTMENYCLAKAKLFKMCKTGIINVDDKWSQKIIDEATCDIITYSIDEPSDLQAKNIHYLMDRVVFTML